MLSRDLVERDARVTPLEEGQAGGIWNVRTYHMQGPPR